MTEVVAHEPLAPAEFAEACRGEVHVVGATSAEGVAVARLLLRRGCPRVVLHDSRPRAELRKAFRTTHGAYDRAEQDAIWDDELRPLLDHGRFGDDYLDGLEAAPTVSLGQGWFLDAGNRAAVEQRLAPDARVVSMTELLFALAPGPVLAVTGTNGKSSTVAMVEHLLAATDVPFAVAGNERSSKQVLPTIDDLPRGTLLLLEVSNRQLRQVLPQPHVAAITALTPDHLEEHGGWDGYRAVKARLFECQRPHDLAICMADAPEARAAAAASGGVQVGAGLDGPAIAADFERCVAWFGDELRAVGVDRFGNLGARDPQAGASTEAGTVVLATRADVRVPGEHNLRNVAVAAAVALAADVEPAAIAPALRTFTGKALRLQPLGSVGGVDVVSDLKATTPEATAAAIAALAPQPLVLLAGGSDKGLDYAALGSLVARSTAACLLVPGSASDQLAAAVEAAGGHWEAAADGLEASLARAVALAPDGGAVLVSPAAAGFWTTQLQGGPSLQSVVRRLRTEAPTRTAREERP